jgi:[lysine-biosynthesis-protein LysW]---L-2-aminoadipate ligase
MLGVETEVLTPASCLALLGPNDVAIGRIDVRRSLDGVETGLLELGELRRRGIRVLNPPAALLRTHDKLRTARALAAASVAHPRTEHVTYSSPVTSLRPPVVVKPRFGSWGADIVRCNTPRELRSAIDELTERPWFRRRGAIVQSLVPPVGHDLRVLVAGGRIVGAESRVAAPGEWRTNISLGATGCPATVPARARVAALAAAKAVGGDFVGIDLLPEHDDYVVIEVNGAVDFQAYYSLPSSNVFADIAASLGFLPTSHTRSEASRSQTALLAIS